MCGEGVDALSVAELRSLLSPLKQGMLSVENQLAKVKLIIISLHVYTRFEYLLFCFE